MSHIEDKMSSTKDALVALGQSTLSAPAAILRSGLHHSAFRFLREKTGRVHSSAVRLPQMNG